MKEFIEEISSLLSITRKDLLEKDMIIQKLLLDISKDTFCSKNLVFKGGTCLIKSYLGYYRFSEDIDFTWKNQALFQGKSQKEIRWIISELKDTIGNVLVSSAKQRGWDFVLDKKKKEYIEFGGGNKTITFKVWFDSEMVKQRSFVKIQINFVEDVKFDVKTKKTQSLLKDCKEKELHGLYGIEYTEYCKSISLLTYDMKEIVCEKARAILTRRGVKARDFVDLFLIEKRFGIHVKDVRPEIIEKIQFILDLYEKYRINLDGKMKMLESGDLFRWGAEKSLLLQEINEREFYRFVDGLMKDFKVIAKELK
jgi:predicted nucleotidyltransferase component of viral defense system